eukprot:XP_001698207.1 predicted protein [Chlamydomonas reinhardtii]
MTIRGQREPNLSPSLPFLRLWAAADAMVESLQKKECYGGGVTQRAAHLAAHLKATDPFLAKKKGGSGGGKGASDKGSAAVKRSNKKGGAATALEYLTTTFAHLREQRTLVMGDKKDRLLREVAALRQLRGGPINAKQSAAAGKKSEGGKGRKSQAGDGHYLDNLTCVVWEDWRVPERLDTMLAAGDSLAVFVEVHCRDGPEDTRLAMSLSTFVALALCSQRLIAELYQDMALHRRMPLRCGWMYANAIMPTAAEWDRIFGPQAGRLSGLYDGGADLDALGRACMAFHTSRHESPVLDVHALAAHLRATQAAERQRKTAAHRHHYEHEAAVGNGVAGVAGVGGNGGAKEFGVVSAEPGARPPSLLLRPPGDSGFVPGTIHPADLMPGVFYSYFIGSQAFTNTAWHVEDFLLQSINMMVVGRPKAWWWVPRAAEAGFKQLLEDQWELEDVYTKCVPLASETVDKLIKMGCRRTVQLPGSVFLTSPGFAFHTTMSSGWSMADSSNFMANILGKGGKDAAGSTKPPAGAGKGLVAAKKEPGTGGAGRDARNGDQPAAKKIKLEGKQPGRKRTSAVNGSNKAGRAGSGGLQSQSSQQLLTLLQTAGRPQQRAQEQQPQPKAEPGSGSGGVGARAAGVKEEPGQASGHGNGVQGNTNGCTGPSGVEHVVMLAKRGNDDLAAHVGLSASGSASGAGASAEAKLLPIKRESSVDGSTLMGLGGGGGGGAYKRSSAEQALPSAARLEHQQLLMQVERAGSGTSGGAPAGRGVLDTLRVMSGGSTSSQLGNSATAGAVAPAALRSSHSASAAGSGLLGSLGLGREDAQTGLAGGLGGRERGLGGLLGGGAEASLCADRQAPLQQHQQHQHLRLPGAGSPRGSLGSALLGGAGAHRQAGIAAEGLRLPFPA